MDVRKEEEKKIEKTREGKIWRIEKRRNENINEIWKKGIRLNEVS